MGMKTAIEWTEVTWNPIRGCSRESEGCRHCYAERMAYRFSATGLPYQNLVKMTSQGPKWTGQVKLIHDLVDAPKHWRRPSTVFVNSMSDLFQERIPLEFIQLIFKTMLECPQHTFQILTKRSERLLKVAHLLPWPSNVWMGVSVEDARVDRRVNDLSDTPAAVKFLSCEPLIGPLDHLMLDDIDWVIVGGESGPGARPMKVEWVQSILKQCTQAQVAFFFKQWGGVRKGTAGRELNGRTYDEMPLLSSS